MQLNPDQPISTRLFVIGAGGHGRVVADAARCAGYADIVFVDDAIAEGSKVMGHPVLGGLDRFHRVPVTEPLHFIVAFGRNDQRLTVHRDCLARGFQPVTVVHPAATVSRHASVGAGSAVFAGCVINPGAVLGEAVIVNTGATVDHDCLLRDGVHLSPGVHLGGAVEIGERSWLGVGVSVRNAVRIAADVMVGVGAAVTSPLDRPGIYVGVPARPLRTSDSASA